MFGFRLGIVLGVQTANVLHVTIQTFKPHAFRAQESEREFLGGRRRYSVAWYLSKSDSELHGIEHSTITHQGNHALGVCANRSLRDHSVKVTEKLQTRLQNGTDEFSRHPCYVPSPESHNVWKVGWQRNSNLFVLYSKKLRVKSFKPVPAIVSDSALCSCKYGSVGKRPPHRILGACYRALRHGARIVGRAI